MNLPILAQPFRLLCASILCFWLAVMAFPALAQSEAASTETTADPQQALGQLIEVLRDDAAREALITELEANLPAEGTEAAAEAGASPSDGVRSLGGQIAEFTSSIVDNISSSLGELGRQLASVPSIFAGLNVAELNVIWGLLTDIAVLAVVTYGGLAVARRLIVRPRERLNALFHSGGWVAKPVALVLELALDIAAALLPYALGYVLAVTFLGISGAIGLEHTLYLNAFLMIEVALSVLRSVTSPNLSEQRLVHLSDGEARATMAWSRVLVSLFVFGQMLVLPLVTANVSFAAGRAISVVLLVLTLLVAAIALLVARQSVGLKLNRMIEDGKARRGLDFFARYWHVFGLVYLGILTLMALTRTSAQFQGLLWSHAGIGLAVLVGFIALNTLKRVLGNGVSLPARFQTLSPDLQRQISYIIPVILRIARFLVVLAVIVACLHALGLFSVIDFIESEFGARVAGATVTVLVILAIAIAAWIGVNAWVDARISPQAVPPVSARKRTLFTLLRNAVAIAIIVITLMFVLSEVGINIAPLLASAGVIGLAVGFGAQKLVQDIINGIFIQFEGAIDVGDIITVAGITGEAERLTIRSVAIRDLEGSYHIIPFSSVDTVTNYMRGFSFALIYMGVSYREDAEYVKTAMLDAFEELRANPEVKDFLIADFEWHGVNEFGASEVVFRARFKTLPGQQWAARRAYYGILKRVFDERGIEIPYPHQTLYFGEDKAGNAPPIRIVRQEADEATQGQGTAPVAVRQTAAGIEIPDNVAQPHKPAKSSKTRRPRAKNKTLPSTDAEPDNNDES